MPSHDLADADKAALIELLRETIAADRYPLSPRIRKLRAILAKLEPVPPRPEPFPPPKPAGEACAGGSPVPASQPASYAPRSTAP
jgi:hypothetical protein